jgi:hypothetical protein
MRPFFAFCLAVITACASAQQAPPQSKAGIVLRGAEYAFSISLPDNWNLDTADRADRDAARAVFYPATLGSKGCRIDVLPATKKLEGIKTLPNLLAYSACLDSTHGARHIDNPVILTKDGKKVPVITSAYKDWQSVCAYIDEPGAVIVLSLYVPELGVQEKAFNALTEIVRSYTSIKISNH